MSLHANHVDACSQPTARCEGSVSLFGVLTDRPTNGCVLINNRVVTGGGWGGSDDAGMPDAGAPRGEFAFVGPDGTRVLLVPGTLWCPERELLPNTEYALVGPANIGGCLYGAEFEYGRFTTGAGPDTTPPPTPAPPTSLSCSVQSCESSACCGPYVVTVISASWGGVEDDSGVVLYEGGISLRSTPSYRWYRGISGAVMFEQNESFGIGASVGPSSVTAIDIANNTSAPSPLTVSCPPPEDAGAMLDAGVTPDAASTLDAAPVAPLDAGTERDAGVRASGGGCTASARNTGLLAALSFALAALLHRKRTRSVD
jgi:hypothetical protein